jgi:hypothetical protein
MCGGWRWTGQWQLAIGKLGEKLGLQCATGEDDQQVGEIGEQPLHLVCCVLKGGYKEGTKTQQEQIEREWAVHPER